MRLEVLEYSNAQFPRWAGSGGDPLRTWGVRWSEGRVTDPSRLALDFLTLPLKVLCPGDPQSWVIWAAWSLSALSLR